MLSKPEKRLRIGLYGGMANNMYLFAKAFAAAGQDIVFVRDRTDTYPFSQPVWEDCRLTLPLADGRSRWTWDEWRDREAEVGWTAPPWLVDPMRDEPPQVMLRPRKLRFWQTSVAHRGLLRQLQAEPLLANILRWFASCDVLVVCGFVGEQMAYLSGRPYMIWPHGGDIRLAAGYPKTADDDPNRQALLEQQERMKLAFKYATWIGKDDPKGVGGSYCDTTPALNGKPLLHVPLPVPQRACPAAAARPALRQRLFAEIGSSAPEARLVAFIPSRIDYFWKGHDRLIEGVAGLADVHLVLAGWGNDYERARALAEERGSVRRMTFLPCSMSKPVLLEMMSACDLVIDQFNLGTYGSIPVEAMAGGVPVMMYIDRPAFEARGWEPPPVLNCRSVEEIRATFARIVDGAVDLEEAGRRASHWHSRFHSPAAVVQVLDGIFAGGPIKRTWAAVGRSGVSRSVH